MTLFFHKVMFDAVEILDLLADSKDLLDFQEKFCDKAGERSRE